MNSGRLEKRSWSAAIIWTAAAIALVAATLVALRREGSSSVENGLDAGTRAITGGYFEASGVAHVPGTRQLLFVDDDRPRELFVLEVDSTGTQSTSAAGLALGADVTDMEGITHDGGYFYVVGSQSKPTGFDGDGLVRFSYDSLTRTTRDVKSIRDLKTWLARNVAELRGTERRIGDHVLNIEGLAWDPERRRLLLGLRAPVLSGAALVIPVKLIDSLGEFSSENLRTDGPAIRLPLGGAGIRSIEFDAESRSFVLITGAELNEETREFQVLEWSGLPDALPRLVTTYSRTLKPEGFTRARIDGRSVRLLIFDTGRLTVIE